jgi:hypothetical protein
MWPSPLQGAFCYLTGWGAYHGWASKAAGLVKQSRDWRWASARGYESDGQRIDPDLPTLHGLPSEVFVGGRTHGRPHPFSLADKPGITGCLGVERIWSNLRLDGRELRGSASLASRQIRSLYFEVYKNSLTGI